MKGPYRKRAVQFDKTGHLLDELLCVKCTCLLRGQTLSSVCPNCGTAVGRTVKGDLLKFADPAWVMKMATGIGWILIAMVASFAIGVLINVIAPKGSGGGNATSTLFLELFTGAVSLIGVWMLTTPDPAASQRERSEFNTRILARYSKLGAFVLLILTALIILIAIVVAQQPTGSGAMPLILASGVTISLSLLVNIACFFFCGFFAIGLTRRMPNKSLKNQIVFIMLGSVVVALLLVGLLALIPMPGANSANNPVPLQPAHIALMLFVLFGSIVLSIWMFVLIIVFRSKLIKAASDAHKTWASKHHRPVDVAQWEQQNLEDSAATTPDAATPDTESVSDPHDDTPDETGDDDPQWDDEPEGESQIDMSQWPNDPGK